MFGLHPLELIVVGLLFLLFPLLIISAWKLCVRVGFPGWLGLLVLAPGGIVALLCVLAFAPWPIDSRPPSPSRP
jgi:hypothetical protein